MCHLTSDISAPILSFLARFFYNYAEVSPPLSKCIGQSNLLENESLSNKHTDHPQEQAKLTIKKLSNFNSHEQGKLI